MKKRVMTSAAAMMLIVKSSLLRLIQSPAWFPFTMTMMMMELNANDFWLIIWCLYVINIQSSFFKTQMI